MSDNQRSFDQTVRNYIYRHFAERARPPSVADAALALGAERDRVKVAFERLHRNHAIFLEPNSLEPLVRMANPFSAVPTLFRVHASGNSYWANCAWDMLGIPAALESNATIEAQCADCGEIRRIDVPDGRVTSHDEIAHFLIPFRQWYDDLVFT